MSTKLTTLNDEQLAQVIISRRENDAAFQRATESFNELYSRHSRWLLSYLSVRVDRNDLDDIHQVVWQRVWERIEEGFRGGKFQVWLFFIARNHLIDLSRRPRVDLYGDAEASLVDSRSSQPDVILENREQQAALEESLKRLKGKTAEVVARRLRGESYEDICTSLSITKARAYKLLRQARIVLTDWLNAGGTTQAAIG